MSKASQAADAYGRQEAQRFMSRVRLSDSERELLEQMFALAWFEGYKHGAKATSEAVVAVLSASREPKP